jgi:hypothetical protein
MNLKWTMPGGQKRAVVLTIVGLLPWRIASWYVCMLQFYILGMAVVERIAVVVDSS